MPAVEGRTLPLAQRADWLAADAAWRVGAAVDEILLLEISRTAVRVDEVAQAAAARGDGGFQRGADFRHEAFVAPEADAAGGGSSGARRAPVGMPSAAAAQYPG